MIATVSDINLFSDFYDFIFDIACNERIILC